MSTKRSQLAPLCIWRNFIYSEEAYPNAGMAELADAADSKSADRKVVGVRPPLPAPFKTKLRMTQSKRVLKEPPSAEECRSHNAFSLNNVKVAIGSKLAQFLDAHAWSRPVDL